MDKSRINTANWYGDFVEQSVKTPNYFKKLKLGERLPFNRYEWQRWDVKSPSVQTYNGLRSELQARGPYRFIDGILNGKTRNGRYCPSVGEGISIAQNRLLKKVRGSDIDLGVALGEYRETAHFVASAMTKTAKAIWLLRQRKVSEALTLLTGRKGGHYTWNDLLGVPANVWLALQYGAVPLIRDVYAACELLQKGYQNKTGEPITVRSGHDITVQTGEEVASSYYRDSLYGYIHTRGEIRFWVENPLLKTLDQCGVLNPLAVAWELKRLSFVWDWFAPIGEFITNIVPPQGVSFVDGYISTQARGFAVSKTDIPPAGPTGWHTRSESVEVFKRRSPLTSFPTYHVVVPDISLEKSQIASGLALLYQAVYGEKGAKSPGLRI